MVGVVQGKLCRLNNKTNIYVRYLDLTRSSCTYEIWLSYPIIAFACTTAVPFFIGTNVFMISLFRIQADWYPFGYWLTLNTTSIHNRKSLTDKRLTQVS